MKKVVSYVHISKIKINDPAGGIDKSVEIDRNFKNCTFDLFLLNLPLKPSSSGSHIRIYYNKHILINHICYIFLFNQCLHIHKKGDHILWMIIAN